VFHCIPNDCEAKVTSSTGVPPRLKPVPEPSSQFTGRENILHILMHCFFPNNQCELQMNIQFVLYGLGGIGKSQIVLKFLEQAQP
jgi:hypothetical protein